MPSSLICSSRLWTLSGAISARSRKELWLVLIELWLGARNSGGDIVVEGRVDDDEPW
jgi:hypothetical protein